MNPIKLPEPKECKGCGNPKFDRNTGFCSQECFELWTANLIAETINEIYKAKSRKDMN